MSSTCLALNQSPGLIGSAQDLGIGEIAQGTVRLDRTEMVARPFLDDIGDHEVVPVRRQLGQRRTTRKSA